MHNARVIAILVLLPLGCLHHALANDLSGSRPNIIFLLTDDQGYGDLSVHGNPILKTPALDKLHSQSLRFTDFHVSPTCSPTRSALMTGRHEFKNGISHTILERERLTLNATTLAQVLQHSGYATGIFGKWHLGDEEQYQPDRRGFDEVFIHGGGGIGQVYPGSCGDAPANTYFNPAIMHNGTFVKTQGFCTDLFYDQASQWITEKRKSNQPFFAYVATNAPHSPYTAKPEDAKKYEDLVDSKQLANFYGMIHNIDQNVAKLMDLLDRLEIADTTLVVFMNDNGTAAGQTVFNAGMRGAKGTVWLGGTRANSFWRWPGKIVPADCDALTAHIDFFPTIAELAGAKLPAEVEGQVEGLSLLKLLENPEVSWPDRTLFTHLGRWPKSANPNLSKYQMTSVRTKRWSLVSPDGGEKARWQLFDLQSDYGQTQNVIGEHPEIAQQLSQAMDQWWNECLPLLVNENAIGPKLNPFAEKYWKQFGGGPTDQDLKRMDPNQPFPPNNNSKSKKAG